MGQAAAGSKDRILLTMRRTKVKRRKRKINNIAVRRLVHMMTSWICLHSCLVYSIVKTSLPRKKSLVKIYKGCRPAFLPLWERWVSSHSVSIFQGLQRSFSGISQIGKGKRPKVNDARSHSKSLLYSSVYICGIILQLLAA